MPVSKGIGNVQGFSRKGGLRQDRKRTIELTCLKNI
jgi:hypothetical protein